MVAVVVVATLGLRFGCSDDAATPSTDESASTAATDSSAGAATKSTTPASATPVSGTPVSGTPASGAKPKPPVQSAPAPVNSAPAESVPAAAVAATAVAAGGWRMVITAPSTGAIVGRVMSISYEITGESREPGLALDVSFTAEGSTDESLPVRVAVVVGRGFVDVEVGDRAPGIYDVWVRLVLDRRPLTGAVVRIAEVTYAG